MTLLRIFPFFLHQSLLLQGRRQIHSNSSKRRRPPRWTIPEQMQISRPQIRRPSIPRPFSAREGEEGRDSIRWGCLPLSSRVSRYQRLRRDEKGGIVGKRVDNRGCTPFPPPTGTLSTRGNRLGSFCLALPIPAAFSTPSPSFFLLLNFPLHLNFWPCFFPLHGEEISYNSRIKRLQARICFFSLLNFRSIDRVSRDGFKFLRNFRWHGQ